VISADLIDRPIYFEKDNDKCTVMAWTGFCNSHTMSFLNPMYDVLDTRTKQTTSVHFLERARRSIYHISDDIVTPAINAVRNFIALFIRNPFRFVLDLLYIAVPLHKIKHLIPITRRFITVDIPKAWQEFKQNNRLIELLESDKDENESVEIRTVAPVEWDYDDVYKTHVFAHVYHSVRVKENIVDTNGDKGIFVRMLNVLLFIAIPILAVTICYFRNGFDIPM